MKWNFDDTKINLFFCDVIQDFVSLQEIITKYTGLFTQRNHSCCTNEVSGLWCHIFTLVMRKVRDLIFLRQESCIQQRYSPNVTAARQNEVVPLWCSVFVLLIKKARDYILLQDLSRTWQRYSPNVTPASQHEVIHLWCHSIFSSHCRKMEHD